MKEAISIPKQARPIASHWYSLCLWRCFKFLGVGADYETYQRLFAFLGHYKGRFITAILAMVAYGMTDGAVPFIIRSVLDDVFGNKDKTMLWVLPIALVSLAAIRSLFGFYQRYLMATVGHRIVRDMRNNLSSHLLKLSPAFYSHQTSGNLVARMTNDTLLVRTALTDGVSAVLRDSIRVIALFCAALYIDPVLALISAVGLPLGVWPVIAFGKKVRRLSRVGQEQFGGLTAILHECILGHKVVQAYGMEDREKEKFDGENQKFTDVFEKSEFYGALAGPTNEIIASLATSAVILYGGLSVIGGVRTQGDFIAFLTSIFLLYEPIRRLGRVNNIVQLGVAASERIFEVLDTEPEISDCDGAKDLEIVSSDVELKNVYFSYEKSPNPSDTGVIPETIWALEGVSMKIHAGKTLALVGMSGGGKSTIANLLLRYYDPDMGSICIGGYDISQVTLKSLRSSIAYVSQHTFLFNDTVLANIAYGRHGAAREEIVEAAKAAYAHDFITALPQGYDTVIGEQGFKLSGGERSRVAIARALIKDAPILILDEATAALDSQAEALVQAAIDRLMSGRTALVIAHRLATIRGADAIAVIGKGRVLEMGTHEELLRMDGEYSKLYRVQFKTDQV